MSSGQKNLGPAGIAVREQVAVARGMYLRFSASYGTDDDPVSCQRFDLTALNTLEDVASRCETALRRDPENAIAIDLLSQVRIKQASHHALQAPKRATEYIKKGLDACAAVHKRDPKHANALIATGNILVAEGVVLHGCPGRDDSKRAMACVTLAATKFEEALRLYPRNEYVATQVLLAYKGLVFSLVKTLMRSRAEGLLEDYIFGCLDIVAPKFEEAVKVCKENGTASVLWNDPEPFGFQEHVLGITLFHLANSPRVDRARRMQLFEGAKTNLEVAVAKGEERSKYSTFSSEQQMSHNSHCEMLGLAHYALADHDVDEAMARDQAGYYHQAYMLYMSSAEHSKVCLEHWILMSKYFPAYSRKELMDETAVCLRRAERLKQDFE